jgi:lactate dehydrogenase-like 2-hydroxyacid dehydrogenase
MEVIYWSRSLKESDYTYTELKQLLTEADVLFPTMALNDETKALLVDDALGTMKPSAMLISTSHGLFNQDLVLDMVKEGKLYGYGFEAEPGSFNKFDGNVWAAPAYAWATDSTMHNSMVKWIDNMVNAVQRQFPNRIN